MNFFLFVFLGVVSAFNSNILLNPREFVASVQNADPAIVNQLIDYAKALIADGETVRSQVIKADDDAAAAAAVSASNLEAASNHLADMQEIQQEKTDWLAAKTSELKEATEIWEAAIAHMKDSQAKFDQADETMITELARIAEEDQDLKEVRTLLTTLMPEFIERSLGRALLTTVDETIDPHSVQAVIDLVDDLLAAGQTEAKEYTRLRNEAKAVLDAAIIDHNNKETIHTHAVGAESVAQQMLAEANDNVSSAENAETLAKQDKVRKDDAAAEAESHRESEEKRINAEKADFEQIIDLLGNLLS